MTDLPFVGQKFWGNPLNTAIEERTSSEGLADRVREPGPLRDELMDTFVAQEDTGAAGLAVLAANLPEEARDAPGITIDTTVGTRVFVGDVMIYGDTGWRDIAQVLNWTPAGGGWWNTAETLQAYIRRVNDTVFFNVRGRTLPDGQLPSTTARAYEGLPVGFQATPIHVPVNVIDASSWTGDVGALHLFNDAATGRLLKAHTLAYFFVVYSTSQAWPSSLPGTPR